MTKIQMKIEDCLKAIEESKAQGLDYIEILANVVPVPPGWAIVQVPEVPVVPAVDLAEHPETNHPGN